MSRGCPGGGRRALVRSPLKSLMDGASTLHRLLLAPSQLTPEPLAGRPSPLPAPAVRVVCGSGARSWFARRPSRAPPGAGLPRHLQPAPRHRPRGSPGPLTPRSPPAPAKGSAGSAAEERDGTGRGGGKPRPNAEINRCNCLSPCSCPGQNPGAVKTACPRLVGAPGPRSQPWHVLALPGKGQCPSVRSPAGRGPGGGTSALRQRARGTGLRRRFQHVYVQGGGASAPPAEPPGPLASSRRPAGPAGPRRWGEGGEGTGGQAFLAKPRGDISGRSGNASLSFPGSL